MNRSFNTKSSTRNIHEDYASDAECYTNGYLSDAGMYVYVHIDAGMHVYVHIDAGMYVYVHIDAGMHVYVHIDAGMYVYEHIEGIFELLHHNVIHFTSQQSVMMPTSLLMQSFVFKDWFPDFTQQNF